MFFGPSRVFFAVNQKNSFTKKFSIDLMNLNPGGCLQYPKFAFYHLGLLRTKLMQEWEEILFKMVIFSFWRHNNKTLVTNMKVLNPVFWGFEDEKNLSYNGFLYQRFYQLSTSTGLSFEWLQVVVDLSLTVYTACVNPFDFFFWPAKCIKTKKFNIKLNLFYSLVTTISLSGTNLNRNAFYDLLFESWS